MCGSILATAAAAKLLQSCPTLCDPIDGSPPGFPIPGILQARTLETLRDRQFHMTSTAMDALMGPSITERGAVRPEDSRRGWRSGMFSQR